MVSSCHEKRASMPPEHCITSSAVSGAKKGAKSGSGGDVVSVKRANSGASADRLAR